ncbi:MAG: magnesium transporter CorA family protein [Saprospiraceae bacterium]|nr:magnesium transporter CorA family protein [Saprospiraceae bacterium]
MIHYYTTDKGKLVELDAPQRGCWIHISPPIDVEDLKEISEEHAIPLDFLTDSLDMDERSRYEKEEDVRLILINSPILNDDEYLDNEAFYITSPIGIILTAKNIFTISPVNAPVIDRFLEGRVKSVNINREDKFVLQILEQTVFSFLDSLKKLNLKRHLIERELYDSSRTSELQQLLRIEKSLVYFVNSLSSNELLKLKMKRTDFLGLKNDEVLTDLFEDIIIDNGQALEMANVYTNILSGTMEAYASIISNNLNIFIQRLTVVTIILMVPTLVASFYGMNVPLPFGHEESENVFVYIVIVSVIVSLFLAWFFRRKNFF